MPEAMTIVCSGPVTTVKLARLAMDPAFFIELEETFTRINADPAVRAVVVLSEGKAFSFGLDLAAAFAEYGELFRGGLAGTRTELLALIRRLQGAIGAVAACPVPVIAAVHGVAFGGGFQLALGADMRFLAPDARMSIMEIKWGLVPDMAGTPILASLVRDDILRDLTYTGRIFSAQEALGFGLATRICDDPRAEAFEVAREIAARSPDAVRAAKRLLNRLSVDPGPALLAESVEQQKLIGSANQLEAVRANIEKRAPKFAEV